MPIYLNREEEIKGKAPLEFYGNGQNLKDWEIQGRTSGNLFDIGTTINDYERAYTIISVDGSSISMKYEASGMTFHYRTHNITTTGTVTIYCKGSKAKPQLLVRLRSMDDTKWLTNSDVTISGMAYNNVYNGWYSYAMSDTFIKTIIIPECLYWNMGVGFNNGETLGEIMTISNPMVISGTYTASTIPPYEPYGGVGDYDETEQKYRIPVTVEGENLVESVTVSDNQALYGVPLFLEADLKPDTEYTFAFQLTEGYYVYWNEYVFTNNTPFVTGAGDNVLVVTKKTRSDLSKNDLKQYNDSKGGWIIHKNRKKEDFPANYNNVQLYEGTYTASTIPPYEVNLYVDNQLQDGDSISLSSTQVNIPTINNSNILTVPTQVQPSNITLTLPQTETEITKILGPLISPRYDITDAYFGNLQVFTVWDTYTGPLPTTLYTTDWGLVDYKIYGTADGAGIKTENLYNYNAPDAVSLNLYPSEENGRLLSGQNNVSIIFQVKPNTTYSIYKQRTTRFRWACYAAAPQVGDKATSFSSSVSNANITLTFTTDSEAAYAVVFIKASSDPIDRDTLLKSVVVVEGSAAAQSIPYGYKIPMRSQNSVVDIYIGDTPLGENEYVSYSDQKIYKYINGVLTPVDPPKELPMITTINGNTTIDTTLEEKQYITSDNKVYCVKNGGRYLLKGSGLRPDNFYSKYRKGGT